MTTVEIGELIGSEGKSNSDHAIIDRLVIVGGGTMGQGISVSAARRGIDVLLVEKDEDSLERSISEITATLDREIERWAMTESEKKGILSHIQGTNNFSDITDQRYLIEALPEKLDLKIAVLRHLEKQCVPEAIFLTNTSTLSITELGSSIANPDRLIGMHFMNPVPKVRVVELVKGLRTSPETFHTAMKLVARLERTAIEVFESPGYVTTRVMMPLVNEAIQVLMEGIASADDIDKAISLGYELPVGPLAMADRIGLDMVLNWLETLFHDLGDSKYRPCPLLRMLVRAGHLGIKTGQGFFRYDNEGRALPGSGQVAAAFEKFLK